MANVAKYFTPLHNLPVFNPDEFPTTDPKPTNVKGLTIITSQVAINGATIDENTTLINNYCKLFTTTLPTVSFKSGDVQSIAYTGGTVPTGVPFMLILNLNLGTTSNLISIFSVTVSLTNVGFTGSITSTWNNQFATNQTRFSPQFVFTGKGNGNPFVLTFLVEATSSPQKVITLNTANTNQGYVNDLMMFYL
jgi:hypothetical protein